MILSFRSAFDIRFSGEFDMSGRFFVVLCFPRLDSEFIFLRPKTLKIYIATSLTPTDKMKLKHLLCETDQKYILPIFALVSNGKFFK